MILTKTILLSDSCVNSFPHMADDKIKTPAQLRIEAFLESLEISVYALSSIIGYSQTRIWRALDKKQGIDSNLLATLAEKFPQLNIDWVITGRGEMLKTTDVVNEPSTEYNTSIPVKLITKHTYVEYVKHYFDPVYIRKQPSNGSEPREKGIIRDFEVVGNHLEDPNGDGIQDGDIIRCQYITSDLYDKVLKPGQLVALVTKKEIQTRIISELTDNHITIIALNPLYPAITIPRNTIAEIWAHRSLLTNRDFKHLLYKH
jgi:hypothetical protein